MIWPFKKKQLDLATLPSILEHDGDWSLAMLSDDGRPLILRFNDSAAAWAGHSALSIKLGFACPLNQPVPDGLPAPEENQQLSDVEDTIDAEVSAVAQGLKVMSVTNGVMKEFIYYIVENVDIKSLHERLMSIVQSHEVQCIAERERNWSTYRSFQDVMASAKKQGKNLM